MGKGEKPAYVMKQKLFCWGDDFTIKDEQGQDVFFVDGKAFSIGEKLSFQDMAGNELAFIRQKLLAWGPTYEIYRGSELAAVVKKHLFTFLNCKFTVDVPGPDDLEAEGNFLDHEYRFTRGEESWPPSQSSGSPGQTPMAWRSLMGRTPSCSWPAPW